jgi:hypothetical protein
MIYGPDGILAKPTNHNGKIANVSPLGVASLTAGGRRPRGWPLVAGVGEVEMKP